MSNLPSISRVLVVGPDLEPLAREAFPAAAVDAGRVDALPGPGTGAAPDLVVLDAGATHPHLLAAAIEGMAARPDAPALILTGAAAPTAVVRAMMKLTRSDLLEPPLSAADLGRAAERLMRQQPPQAAAPAAQPAPPPVTQNRCWAVTSAVGGSGGTTVSIELATALSRLDRQRPKICLIDLNLADGASAAYLGASANMILDPDMKAGRIDAALLDMLVARPNEHLDLLAAPRDPQGFARAQPEVVLKLLDVACGVYSHVIIDMPRHRQPWTVPVLAGCDEVMIVSELTVPALLAARSMAEELERDLTEGPAPRIVLNRLASRMFGPAPSMSEAEKALGRQADAGVSSDWEAAAASVNLGGPISEHRPKSKIVRDVEALAKHLMEAAPRAASRVA